MGITKHNWLIKDVDDIPRVVAAAFHVATTGRPGPVLIDLPKDISNAQMEWYWPSSVDELDLPGYHPVTFGDPVLIGQAVELISQARRPVFYVGGGVLKARAAEALRVLADRTGIPVVTTLMARGAFPDSHPQALGMPGMHGHYTAVTALQKSDLLISLGRTIRRPGHREDQRLRAGGQGDPRRHRPGRARQGAHPRRGHRR